MVERNRRNTMKCEIEEIGEIYKNTTLYQKKKEKAKEAIRKAFEIGKRPYLALSAGKDSVAMIGLVDEVARELDRTYRIFTHVSDASYPGTVEIAKELAERFGRKLILDVSEYSAFELIDDVDRQRFGKKGVFFSAIEKTIKENDFDLSFVGVRAYESKRRMKAVKAHGYNFVSHVPTFCNICFPLAWFKYEDVCATIMEYKLPIHPIYYKVNTNYNNRIIRLGYVTAKDMLNHGTAVFIKRNYPELFNKLVKAYPEVNKYV